MKSEDPLLLIVKMFLAEVMAHRRSYQFPSYVCTNFAKEVFDLATIQGIRCGYTLIALGDKASHALIAFDTDYGRVYIEPQEGNQFTPEDVTLGKSYPIQLEGVPRECLITNIRVLWNDEFEGSFQKCFACGYLMPLLCPVCGGLKIQLEETVKLEARDLVAETES